MVLILGVHPNKCVKEVPLVKTQISPIICNDLKKVRQDVS